jgi:hypothetical protein
MKKTTKDTPFQDLQVTGMFLPAIRIKEPWNLAPSVVKFIY